MTFNSFIYELREANKDVEIRTGIKRCDTIADTRIFAAVPASELELPEGYRVEGNWIKSDDPDFELLVDGLANVVPGHAYPLYDYDSISLDDDNYENIAIVMKMINPDIDIRIIDPSMGLSFEYICSKTDISEITLPKQYTFDSDTNCLFRDGKSTGIHFIKKDDFYFSEIIPRYDFEKVIDEQYDKDVYRMYPQLDPEKESKKSFVKRIKDRFKK